MGWFLQVILSPVSLIYGMAMVGRNLMFDVGLLSQRSFDKSIISVGNLSYGGTGKTPLTEYLIRLLQSKHSLGTLSRGYGRESKGFILASKRSNIKYIGDEPLQYLKKFENIQVAVDENRVRGIGLMIQKHPELDVILLDDAFQHRYVKPGLSILLSDYHHMYTDDYVLPSGTLREFRSGAKRADIIVVTKTPKIFSPITRKRILEDLKPAIHQRIFFSYLKYSDPIPFNEKSLSAFPPKIINILLFNGIANDYPLREHLERMCSELIIMKFSDHHQFTEKDIDVIKKKFDDLPTQKKILVTTEKDVMRLKTPELSTKLKDLPLFYVPVEIDFHGTDKQLFDNEVINYVEKNKRNHRIS